MKKAAACAPLRRATAGMTSSLRFRIRRRSAFLIERASPAPSMSAILKTARPFCVYEVSKKSISSPFCETFSR